MKQKFLQAFLALLLMLTSACSVLRQPVTKPASGDVVLTVVANSSLQPWLDKAALEFNTDRVQTGGRRRSGHRPAIASCCRTRRTFPPASRRWRNPCTPQVRSRPRSWGFGHEPCDTPRAECTDSRFPLRHRAAGRPRQRHRCAFRSRS